MRLAAWLLIAIGVAYLTCRMSLSFAATQSTRAGGSGSGPSGVEEKLDAILANQDLILKRFDAVLEELRVIKIRASMQ
jgi:hypothetical protein